MVTSPTYLLDNTYLLSDVDGGDPTCGVHEHDAVIHHLDLYRLPNGCDLTFLSIPKIYARNLCLIEWPERLGKFKPDDYVDIDLRIHPENDHRSALITLNGEKYADRVEDFANSLHEFRINQHHAL
jgi:tRNA threonylcarbamoyladenosine biosynthesis protein TsaE